MGGSEHHLPGAIAVQKRGPAVFNLETAGSCHVLVRIISGVCKGRKLCAPQGMSLRPTSDHVKETLFNMIAKEISGAVVLDVFAGTGNIGIEALSRGAERSVFIEKSPAHIRILQRNLALCGLEPESEVYCGDANKILLKFHKLGRKFDIIYLDPPYRQTNMLQDIFEKLLDYALIYDTGLIIVEHAHLFTPQGTVGGWGLYDRRYLGDTTLSFYRSQRFTHPLSPIKGAS